MAPRAGDGPSSARRGEHQPHAEATVDVVLDFPTGFLTRQVLRLVVHCVPFASTETLAADFVGNRAFACEDVRNVGSPPKGHVHRRFLPRTASRKRPAS